MTSSGKDKRLGVWMQEDGEGLADELRGVVVVGLTTEEDGLSREG